MVLELMVSQDGGVLCEQKLGWQYLGHRSVPGTGAGVDERLKNAPSPRYLIADAKLYHEDNAPNLEKSGSSHVFPTPSAWSRRCSRSPPVGHLAPF